MHFGPFIEALRRGAGMGFGFGDSGDPRRRDAQTERLASLTYEQILRTKVAFSTAAALRERLTGIRDELGLDGIVAELNPGGMLSKSRSCAPSAS